MDVVIPLSIESKSNNDELRILLRSIDRNLSGIGRIVVVTPEAPDWLVNCTVLKRGDPLPHNKDGNIIDKVVFAILEGGVSGNFIFTADDNVFTGKVEANRIPLLHNVRGPSFFMGGATKWYRRMSRTFGLLQSRGLALDRNFDCHAPQVFNAEDCVKGLMTVDYRADNGYCIYTLLRGLAALDGRIDLSKSVDQRAVKSNHESKEEGSAPLDKMFAGYNDAGFFDGGLRERLLKRFPDKCRYER